jgi:hypothetical protein
MCVVIIRDIITVNISVAHLCRTLLKLEDRRSNYGGWVCCGYSVNGQNENTKRGQ